MSRAYLKINIQIGPGCAMCNVSTQEQDPIHLELFITYDINSGYAMYGYLHINLGIDVIKVLEEERLFCLLSDPSGNIYLVYIYVTEICYYSYYY